MGGWSDARRVAFGLAATASVCLAGFVAHQMWRTMIDFPPPREHAGVIAFVGALVCGALATAIAAYVPSAAAAVPASVAASVAPVSAGPCPACAASFAPGERLLACEGCGSRYHPTCLRALGRCSGPSCTGRRAVPARAGR